MSKRATDPAEGSVAKQELAWLPGVGMDFIRRAPCTFPEHLEDEAEVIDNWLQTLECTERQRKRVLSCLGGTYLQKLPLVGKSRPWPKNPVAKNFRYHFRAQISRVLGWRERTKFPEHIDALIRERLWPEHVGTDECKGGQQGSGGSKACAPQPHNAKASQEANKPQQQAANSGRE